MTENVPQENRLLAATSYAVGIPALYIILTEKRNDKFLFYHGSQALFLWIGIIVAWILLRVLLDMLWSIIYIPFLSPLVSLVGLVLWVYALYCGYKAYGGEYFEIPYISDITKHAGA